MFLETSAKFNININDPMHERILYKTTVLPGHCLIVHRHYPNGKVIQIKVSTCIFRNGYLQKETNTIAISHGNIA